MNYELIIKLAKLANNNPNDNEANSAARKVCKLIAEGEYRFTANTNIPPNRPNKPDTSRPPTMDYWEQIIRDMASTPPPWGRYDAGVNEPFRGRPAQSDRQRQREDEEKERRYRQSEEYQRRKRDEKLREEMNQRARQQARGFDFNEPKHPMKCTKCGQQKMTSFIGAPQLFVCIECLWR